MPLGGMMSESDYHYFHRRAAEERAAAARSDHPIAVRMHLELAQRYDEVATASTASLIELKTARG